MSSGPALSSVEIGETVATRTIAVTRDSLVRYAGASGDFNPIHYNDAVAESVGLPGVIAHGMFTMGSAAAVVEEWAGAGNVVDYQCRFTRPIPVPAVGEAQVLITAKVGAVDVEALTARIDLTVEFDGQTVLGKARALVACS